MRPIPLYSAAEVWTGRSTAPAVRRSWPSAALGGCAAGEAKITTGGRLRARYVIHAVGPIYRRERAEQAAELLARAYRRSLEVAAENGVRSVAFPSISTGAYGYPMEEAAPIALRTVTGYLAVKEEAHLELVRFVLYGRQAYEVYRRALTRLIESRPSD